MGALPARAAVDPAPVVAAERAFAADGLALGIRDSFLKHAAPDGLVLQPEPVNAQAAFTPRPSAKGPPLVWWPLWAGIARSGDLGFTSGPYTYDGRPGGYYFTVWKKQPDGSWKWVFDGGPPSDMTGAAPQGSPVTYLPLATAQAGSADRALEDVAQAEEKLAAAADTDLKAAYLAVMAPDGRLVGSPAKPATTPDAFAEELATRPQQVDFAPGGAAASRAGDLVWTYGEALWSEAGQNRRGHYVRVWQDRKDGWKLVFDELLPVPAAKSAN